jgi:1,4-alpha-glucan branching enzyme
VAESDLWGPNQQGAARRYVLHAVTVRWKLTYNPLVSEYNYKFSVTGTPSALRVKAAPFGHYGLNTVTDGAPALLLVVICWFHYRFFK